MSKDMYWAPVNTKTGDVWVNLLRDSKKFVELSLCSTCPNWKTVFYIEVRKVQIVVLPQKKRKK